MNDKDLMWHEIETLDSSKEAIFDMTRVRSRSSDGVEGVFLKVTPADWVTVIPRLPDGRFLMVRQYRHGSASLSNEFPAGVMDDGEEPYQSALRELEEETGYRAGKITPIGKINPNPAFMTNTSYTFLAEGLKLMGDQKLDEHERISFFTMSEEEIDENMGKGLMNSAIMVQAWFWYKGASKRSS